MSTSKIFFWFCICFVLGIFLNSFFYFGRLILLIFLILGIFLISIFWQYKKLVVLGFCVLFLVFGVYKHQLAQAGIERPELKKFYDQEVLLIGNVVEEPDIKTNKKNLQVSFKELKTKVLITTTRYPEIRYGDKLKIMGVLKEPPEFEGFNYKDYLKNQDIYFLMSYPEIEILEGGQGNPIKNILISFKNALKQSLGRIAPLPELGFFEALIFGDENNIPENWKQKLNITGTRHIAAVSGMNITIICLILLNALLSLGLWRKHALWLSLILIFFYILMIGAPVSAIRAGIMGSLLLLAQNFGRIANTERLMVFALTFMLFFNPLLLKEGIGFQLSFLAFAGLIYLSPLFLKFLKKLKVPESCQIRMSLASTLSAQLFVLPLLLYNFGQLSLIAPITNVLILPAIPFLTVGSFLFAFIGMFFQTLGQIISLPVQLLMLFIIRIIDIFSRFSWASKTIEISGIFVSTSYFILAVFVFYLKKKQKLWFLDY